MNRSRKFSAHRRPDYFTASAARILFRLIPLVLLAVPLASCSRSKSPTRAQEVQSLTAEGWRLFGLSNYSGALDQFDQALSLLREYPEAHQGRGWALAYLGEFDDARFAFVHSKELKGSLLDTWAGGAFVYSVLGDPIRTKEWAETVLAANSNWVFQRRTTITHRHIGLVLAQAYFSLESYPLCKQELDRIEPGVQHSEDPEDLLKALMRLQGTLRVF